jgi:hypothetical protein
MSDFYDKWGWLVLLVAGAVTLLMGYGVLPMDEAWYKKNARMVRVCGFLELLLAIVFLVLRIAAPHHHG